MSGRTVSTASFGGLMALDAPEDDLRAAPERGERLSDLLDPELGAAE